MDFAVLGAGHETVALAQGLVVRGHRVVAVWTGDESPADLLELSPAAKVLGNPEQLLEVTALDGLLVNTHAEPALDVTRQLAGAGVAVLLFPRADYGIEFIYQLGLVRDEQPDQFRLFPVCPWRQHPAVSRLKQVLSDGRLGHVHQIHLERQLVSRCPADQTPLLTADQIDQAALTDADFLKAIAGEFQQVTALRMGTDEQGFVQATMALAGTNALPAHWSLRGLHGPSGWKLTVEASGGQILLSGSDDWSAVTWESRLVEDTQTQTLTQDYGLAEVDRFLAEQLRDDQSRRIEDLNRTYELLEGAHRSLRRRRTVELYFDAPSERSNFKTQMTAIGCGILVLTLLAMLGGLGLGLVAEELGLPALFMQIVRVLVFAPLFLFLALQLSIILSRPSAR